MRCSEICMALEREYSPEYACDWDNVGLLAGRRDKEVRRILLALDATDEVVHMADEDMVGRRLLLLIQNDISYYAMHTNYDTRGMADLAARTLSLMECAVLDEVKDGEGIGRVGMLPKEMTLHECAGFVKEAYHLPNVKIFGDPEKTVRRAAVMYISREI